MSEHGSGAAVPFRTSNQPDQFHYSSAQLGSQPTSSSLPPDSFFVLTFFLSQPQKCSNPVQNHKHSLQAGLIVASSKCLHSLLKAYHCPRSQPFAPSPFPRLLSEAFPAQGCLPFPWAAAAAEWWHQEEGGRMRSQSSQVSSPCGGWAPPLGHNSPPNHLPFTSSNSVHSLNSLPPILWDPSVKTTSSWEWL